MGLAAENWPYQTRGKSPTSSWNWYGPELTVELLAHHPTQLIACLLSCLCREVGPILELFSSSQSCEGYEVTRPVTNHSAQLKNVMILAKVSLACVTLLIVTPNVFVYLIREVSLLSSKMLACILFLKVLSKN